MPPQLTAQLVAACRQQFPALRRRVNGRPAAYFDGPGGTQAPERVIRAVSRSLAETNANCHGLFATSRENDALLAAARAALADLLGADDPDTVVFGPNMTSLTFHLSRSLARTWKPGDEVVVTRLDHDANVRPWVLAARDAGATVRMAAVRPEDCTLDLDDLKSKLTERTRLVAVGCASNAVGTVNPVAEIGRWAHDAGALVFLDAVHYAPHARMDVKQWDCDFAVCSAYKFYGPHVGVLWGRRELLERLAPYKVRPAPDTIPERWMTGTQNHEGIAGALEAVEYLADLGRQAAGAADLGRREALTAAMQAIREYEGRLAARLIDQLPRRCPVTLYGVLDPEQRHLRLPTIALTHRRRTPAQLAEALGRQGLFTWHGNYYASELTEALGLEPEGMLRIGVAHYNTEEEVQRLVDELASL